MNSIQRRLTVVTGLVLLVFLSLTGLFLDRTYRDSIVAAIQQELQPIIYSLMGAAQERQGVLSFANGLSQPRLQQPESGLYALVADASGQVVWRSPSLILEEPALSDQIETFAQTAVSKLADRILFTTSSGVTELYCLSNRVDWEGLQQPSVTFVLCTDQQPYRQSMTQFRYELLAGFGSVQLMLSLALMLVLRWGLDPLRLIRQQLSQLEQGDRQALGAVQPKELIPLVESLNQYIAHQSALRRSHRRSLDDLSHSLKTPLSVLRLAVAEPRPDVSLMQDQVARMHAIVDQQLARVGRVAKTEAAAEQGWISVPKTLSQLMRALGVAYPDHELELARSSDWLLRIHEDDLLDILGNLIENACKYGAGKVAISLHGYIGADIQAVSETDLSGLQICIEDDGPGIEPGLASAVVRRGIRLDSREPGQGIGLAMVAELLGIYSADMRIEGSGLGGAKVIVSFEQARPKPSILSLGGE